MESVSSVGPIAKKLACSDVGVNLSPFCMFGSMWPMVSSQLLGMGAMAEVPSIVEHMVGLIPPAKPSRPSKSYLEQVQELERAA